jgi:hypothetical protein
MVFIWYGLAQGQRGKRFPLRRMAAVEALEEAVGRSAETGRPIHVTAGTGGLSGAGARATVAGIAFVDRATRLAAKYDTELMVTACQPEVYAACQQTVQQAFFAEGKGDMYRDDHVRFLSPTALAYTAGAIGLISREKAAANVIVGYFGGEALLLAEAGAKVGAIQIGGTDNTKQLPFFVAVCDYTLIGEEMFAAGAYLSGDVALTGCLRGQDIGRTLVLGLLVAGVVLRTMGMRLIIDILSK